MNRFLRPLTKFSARDTVPLKGENIGIPNAVSLSDNLVVFLGKVLFGVVLCTFYHLDKLFYVYDGW